MFQAALPYRLTYITYPSYYCDRPVSLSVGASETHHVTPFGCWYTNRIQSSPKELAHQDAAKAEKFVLA
jgi:hypothetical protein